MKSKYIFFLAQHYLLYSVMWAWDTSSDSVCTAAQGR